MKKSLRSSHPTNSTRRIAVIILSVFLLGCFVVIAYTNASNPTEKSGGLSAGTDNSATQKGKYRRPGECPSCSPQGNQEIYIPLTELPEAQGSELVFNSRSPKEMEVTPTFYKLDGTALVGDPVLVQSAEISYVDLKKLIPAGHRDERDWGGMSLSYYGVNREMWAQFRLLDVNGGGNVDEFFVVKGDLRSDIQEAAWWMPRKSTAIIALGNITDAATSATLSFGNGDIQTVSLAPHATEIIRRKKEGGRGAESITINITGQPGSIIPTGVIASKDGSFNSVIRFYDTKGAKQPNLFANGLRLSGVTPHMVLKNTSSSTVTAQPKFITVGGVAAAEPVVLPEISLGPQEITEVDLSPLSQAVTNRHDIDVVSVQVSNSGGPGSLIGSLYGINNSTGANYDTPLRDSGPARTMTGSYPWKITKDFTTFVYVTNISDQQAEFITEINYKGGKFLIDPRKLLPGETAVFDLRKIRDEQMEDNAGRHLPKEMSIGQFKWAVRGSTGGKLVLIGRAEMVSLSRRISTSYSCNDPCPPFYGASIDPFPPPIIVNGTATATIWETAYYGSGYTAGPYGVGATWTVDNSMGWLTPTEAHTTTFTGTTPGIASLDAFIGTQDRYVYDGRDCYWAGTDNEGATALVEITGVGNIQYQSGSNFVDISGTLYVLKGTNVTFKAVPNPPDGTFPSAKPVWGGSSGASGTGQTTSVTFNTTSSSVSNFKTLTATSGNTVTVNIIVYELTGVLTPENDFQGRSHIRFGIEEKVNLSFTPSPSITATQAGGLRWRITTTGTGNGTLPPLDDGTGTYTAPDTNKNVTLKLEVLDGPSKGAGPTKDITIVEPSGGFMTREPGTGLRHVFNTWSVGWKGIFHVTPGDVSFLNLSFYEGTADLVSSGWLSQPNDPHPQSAFAERIDADNTVIAPDQIFSGVENGPYGDGEWHWDIPWHIRTNLTNRDFIFVTIRQQATSDSAGTAVISKGGHSESRVPSDPTSSW